MCEATEKLFPSANDTIQLFHWQAKALFELSDPRTGLVDCWQAGQAEMSEPRTGTAW